MTAVQYAVAVVVWLVPALAGSQTLGLTSLDQNAPIEVEADRGIEWRRDEKRFVARGNVTAKQGNVTLRADELAAQYRETKGKGTQIYSVTAAGNVHLTSGDNSLEGERGVYDLEKEVMTMTGKQVVLVTPDQRVVADQSIEFDNKAQVATIRGNATVVRADQRIRADVLKAFMSRSPKGGAAISRIEAVGNVHVSTPTEVARANKGTYDLAAGTATLSGSVRITRGENQLNGENAEFDVRGGTSRLTGTPGNRDGRVRAMIMPRQSGGEAR